MAPDKKKNKPEKDKLLDHNYDGIEELDNPLPNWWVWLFYATIIFSVIYYIYFTFMAPSSAERVEAKVQQLDVVKQAQKAAAAADAALGAKKDAFPSGPEALALGKTVYTSRCLACHGTAGEGLVGPNMADKYWIHGKGTAPDIYKVIVEGVPAKGMIAWAPLLSDEEMRAVTVYIQTFQGTNPPNAKAPEGELVG